MVLPKFLRSSPEKKKKHSNPDKDESSSINNGEKSASNPRAASPPLPLAHPAVPSRDDVPGPGPGPGPDPVPSSPRKSVRSDQQPQKNKDRDNRPQEDFKLQLAAQRIADARVRASFDPREHPECVISPSTVTPAPEDWKKARAERRRQLHNNHNHNQQQENSRRSSTAPSDAASPTAKPATPKPSAKPAAKKRSSKLKPRSSKKSEDNTATHPLNLPPDERRRLAMSFDDMGSSMNVDSSTPATQTSASSSPANHSQTDTPMTPATETNGNNEKQPERLPTPPPHMSKPPPVDAEACKLAGNKFFKGGDYARAIQEYTKGEISPFDRFMRSYKETKEEQWWLKFLG